MRGSLLNRLQAVRFHNLRAGYVVYFGAVLSILNGLTALAGWAGGWPALLQAGGSIMYADSALFCLLAGLALLAAMRQRYAAARSAGILLALAANLHFTADLAGFSVSVHRLAPVLTAKLLPHAAANQIQIPPATAMVFFLFGCGAALFSRRVSNQVVAVQAAIGVVISAIGLTVLAAFIGPMGSTEPGMALPAALCTLTLGVGLCALCRLRVRSVSEEQSPSSVVIIAIGLILILGGTDTATIVKTRAALLSESGVEVTFSEIRAVQKTVDLLREAESNKRAFLLTRNDRFLGNYVLADAALQGELGADEFLQLPVERASRLRSLITERMAQLERTIVLERQGRHREAVSLIDDESGQTVNEQIQGEAKFLTAGLELEAIDSRVARQALLQKLMNLVLASYGIAILLVAVTVLLTRSAARQHERTSMRIAGAAFRESEASEESGNAVQTPADGRRVLLIDDNEDLMGLVQYAFDKHAKGQYSLTWAKNLKNGFGELTKGGVDVVLLDLGLPESSGVISYACVRGCAPQVPVLVMTGDECQETKDLIVAAGVDGYLVKQHLSGALLLQAIQVVLTKDRPPQVNLKTVLAGR